MEFTPKVRRLPASRLLWLPGLIVVIMVLFGLGLTQGAVTLTWEQAWSALWQADGGLPRIVVWELRLPRGLVALLVGANLAVAGVILQAVARNPLASPNLTGVVAGASLTVVAALTFWRPEASWLPWLAFGGGALGALITLTLAWQGTLTPVRLALAGVAVTALASGCTTAILLFAGPSADQLYYWLAGGLLGRSWYHLEQLWLWSLLGIGASLLLAARLNLLLLEDEVARSLGVSVIRWRIALAALAVLLTGTVVAVAGPIGFVGLVAPHCVRLLLGNDQRQLIPAAALFGAALVLGADLLARTLAAPEELPVGVLTAALGGPLFIGLIRRQQV